MGRYGKGHSVRYGLRVLAAVAFAWSAATAGADNQHIVVSNAYRTFFNTNVSFSVETRKQTAYPADVGTPVFWFDASDTNGWMIASGTGEVSKIPSKGSGDRYLTSSHDEIMVNDYTIPGQSPLWYGRLGDIKGPLYKPSDGVLKGSYIDFGIARSFRALWFNPVSREPGATASNRLCNVGTVIGVYKSDGGSGQILGGGDWNRFSGYTDETRGTNSFESILAWGVPSRTYNGKLRIGLQQHAPQTAYWSGNWEVLAFQTADATCNAEGVGCGNCNSLDASYTCSGQAIAELMIFDRVLTDDEVTRMTVYLEHKWLGRTTPGWNGDAKLSWMEIGGAASTTGENAFQSPAPGIAVPVEVGADESLTIGRLNGGRAMSLRHQLLKTGAGALKLGDARDFGGTVALRGGKLTMGGKTVPAFEDLPSGLALHLDASDLSSITKDANNLVSSITNRGDRLVTADQSADALKPVLVADCPQAGLNLLDFKERGGDGRYLQLSANTWIATMVAVTDARGYCGASILDRMYRRSSGWYYNYDVWFDTKAPLLYNGVIYINDHTSLNPRLCASKTWVNGLELDNAAEGYDTPGLAVVAYRVPAAYVNYFGGTGTNNKGGLRVGEVMAWRRTLTEEEIADVQAYLAKKWLGRTLPGYTDDSGIPDLQFVDGADEAALEVPEGHSATVGELSASGRFYKTGLGTLKVVESAGAQNGLIVKEGVVMGAAGADVATKCEIAAGAALHVDPSRSDLVTTTLDNGTNFVWNLQDTAGRCSALIKNAAVDYSVPFMNLTPEDGCNGLAVVDFGPMAPGWSNNTGANLGWSRNLLGIRCYYMVYNSDNGGGQPVGWNHNRANMDTQIGGRRQDFTRSGSIVANSTALFAGSCANVKNGELYVDGVKTNMTYVPKGGWHLIEIHTAGPVQANCFGNCFDLYVHGGFRMGETLVYERVLSERERIATRNYLLKKWFAKTDAELADLPEAPVAAAPTVLAFAPETGETITVAAEITANNLLGSGTVDAGAETLTVRDLSDFTGTVEVGSGGTLALAGKLPGATPRLVTEGRTLHLDASEGLCAETNATTHAITVKEWRSKLNDGWSAMPGPQYKNWSATNYPDVVVAGLNGLDVVRMPKYRYFLFCKDGMTNRLENIQSVFWVIGSQEGGGFILGGGRRPASPFVSEFVWHRGGKNAGNDTAYSSDPIFSYNPPEDVHNSAVRLNGEPVNPHTVGLSGGYDVLSFVLKDGATVIPNADGLAFDGRIFVPEDYSYRMGNQRIAELIIYDRRLTDSEVAETEAYLQTKWGFAQRSVTNAATVNLAAGATLDCSAAAQYVGAVSGTGGVTGDLTAAKIIVDATAETCVSVNGVFTVPAGLVVEIRNYASLDRMPVWIKVLDATSFAGLENLASAVVTGDDMPPKVRVRFVDGALYAFFQTGTTLFLR
jgi:hypothetical protein